MDSQDKTFKKFLIVWLGQLISAVGSGLTAFALGVFVFEKTHSATSYSLIVLASFLPSFLFMPLGGALADRFNRKVMMMIGDAGAIIGLVIILSGLFLGNLEMWQIYLGVGLIGFFAAIQNPAYKAAISDMVSEKQYDQASGLIQLAGSAQYLISPLVAGLLMKVFEIKTVLLIDVASFVVAVLTVFLIKGSDIHHKKLQSTNPIHDVIDSFKYLFSKKGILWLACLISIVCFYIGLLQTLIGPMILTLSDSHTLGVVLSVSASGMLVSSLFIGIIGVKKNKVFVLSISLLLAGIFYAFIGAFLSVLLITIFGFLFFATLPFVNTVLEVLIRGNIENEKQGRIWSLVSTISQVGYILAFSSAGFLADRVFSPLFRELGQGRGIGVMFIVSGVLVSALAVIIGRIKVVKTLEQN